MAYSNSRDRFRVELDTMDILAMHVLAPLSTSYLPWTISAMRPSGLVAVLNEIVLNCRRSIVELGAGISTWYIARLLSQVGGHLIAVEHDERWADQVETQLAREGLTDLVSVVRAPLAAISPAWPGEDPSWYDAGAVTEALDGRRIDLLVVDGPPAFRAELAHARYPALPMLAASLAEDHAIVLDDIDRTGEQEILDVWERDFGVTFQRRVVDGGIAIGRSGAALSV
ncbi:class I SAM-dependent methyltransferase [Micromonosporaceae bacterium B7E4]